MNGEPRISPEGMAAIDISEMGSLFWVLGFAVWVLMLLALRAGLNRVEASLETRAREPHRETVALSRPQFDQPESVGEIIGQYMEAPIYREVIIRGRKYGYERVQPPGIETKLASNERCLKPGVVYVSSSANAV
jgi:hypothetical protein